MYIELSIGSKISTYPGIHVHGRITKVKERAKTHLIIEQHDSENDAECQPEHDDLPQHRQRSFTLQHNGQDKEKRVVLRASEARPRKRPANQGRRLLSVSPV